MVSLEAMATGIPVVTTNFGPIPEVVGKAACLVDAKAESLARGIEKVLENKNYADKLVALGGECVKKYDINKVADKYYEILKSYS